MLLDFLTKSASKELPRFDRSRCLRMRHRNSGCDLCRRSCRRDAIDFTDGLRLDEEKCSSCLACTAECPTEALACGDFDFERYLEEAAAARPAIVGCAASRAGIRTAIPCVGLLSQAHLAVLALSAKGEIGIDIEPCAACANREMARVLADRLARLPQPLRARVRHVAGRESLPTPGRREFFAALKTTFLREAATAVARPEGPSVVAYSAKQLPLKRKLLNEALQAAAGEERDALIKSFYFAVEIADSCTICTACSAVCPTGALQRKRGENDVSLQFNSAACPGCNLCAAACRQGAIRLHAAEPQTDVFALQMLRREDQAAH